MKKILLIAFLFSFLCSYADDNTALFEKANKAYASKYYKEACEDYLKIIDAGYESSELYYNLGNAYFKQSDFASALLYYEKARKLSPGDEDINFNIKVANTKIKDKIDEAQEFFLVSFFKTVASLFSFEGWAITAIVLLIITLSLTAIYLFSSVLRVRKLTFWLSGAFLLLCLSSFAITHYQYISTTGSSEAIVFTPSLTAKSSPDAGSTDLFVIHEGLKVRILSNEGEWSKIKLSNGSVGWVSTSSLKEI